MLGIGRRAIDEVVALAATKVPMLASKRLAEWSMAQVDIARAEAALSSARAFLRDEVATAWDLVLAGDPVPVTQRARIRLACSHIGTEAVRAVDLAYNTAGGSAVYSSSPISRCFRDIHTASAHIMVSSRIYETFGKLHLGFEVDTSML
jgi:alkylation response protein AidB-like acyl-CoA dehydrogenase